MHNLNTNTGAASTIAAAATTTTQSSHGYSSAGPATSHGYGYNQSSTLSSPSYYENSNMYNQYEQYDSNPGMNQRPISPSPSMLHQQSLSQRITLRDIISFETGKLSCDEVRQFLTARYPGAQLRAKACGILGAVRFLKGYYLVLATSKKRVGYIDREIIYTITSTSTIPISYQDEQLSDAANSSMWARLTASRSPIDDAEERYLSLFHLVDLTKDFYFSYSYSLCDTLQKNKVGDYNELQDMFLWNEPLSADLLQVAQESMSLEMMNFENGIQVKPKARDWIIPVIHGFFDQKRCSIFGRIVSIALIARRSRHFAGTRYLKRGLNDNGFVANEVEVEQIVECDDSISSYVQLRGSIPVYWTQETSATIPKPPIKRNRFDITYSATKKHFLHLFHRYGAPITVLNLIRQNERQKRESILGEVYDEAVTYLNKGLKHENQIVYKAFDFKVSSKNDPSAALNRLDRIAQDAIARTKFFITAPRKARSSTLNMFDKSHSLYRSNLYASLRDPGSLTSGTSFKFGSHEEDDDDIESEIHFGANDDITITNSQSTTPLVTSRSNSPSLEARPSGLQQGLSSGSFHHPLIRPKIVSWNQDLFPKVQRNDKILSSPAARLFVKRASQEAEKWSRFGPCKKQSGIIRTNCIDGLDRTNVAQFAVGLCAFGHQLHEMGVIYEPALDRSSQLVNILMEMYEGLGDHIAQQYGGSIAHKKGGTTNPVSTFSGSIVAKQKELLTSVQRYYSNSFADQAKQDAINLFLCQYDASELVPDIDGKLPSSQNHIWELENDYFLHNRNVLHQDFRLYPDLNIGFWYNPPNLIQSTTLTKEEKKKIEAEKWDVLKRPPVPEEEDGLGMVSFDHLFLDGLFKAKELCNVGDLASTQPLILNPSLSGDDKEKMKSQQLLRSFDSAQISDVQTRDSPLIGSEIIINEPRKLSATDFLAPEKVVNKEDLEEYQVRINLLHSPENVYGDGCNQGYLHASHSANEERAIFESYLKDLNVKDDDASGNKKLQAQYGGTYNVNEGVFEGVSRYTPIRTMYSHKFDSPLVVVAPNHPASDVYNAQSRIETERSIFEQYLSLSEV